jgi:predicted RecB family nuclease
MEAASRFGIKPAEALASLREIYTAASRWRTIGKQLKMRANTLAAYATAFEHPLMEEARLLM